MRKWMLAGMVLAGILGGGCSFFAPGREMVAINVKPDNTVVMVNGIRFESTPIFSEFSTGDDLLISIYRPRMKSRNYVVRRKLSIPGILDAIGSVAIFPAFGLLDSGAWTFENHNIVIDLDQKPTPLAEVKNVKELENL